MDDIICMQNIINITGMMKDFNMGVFFPVDTMDDWFVNIFGATTKTTLNDIEYISFPSIIYT